nr:hypothetical protein [uncultured Bacteroides sp.]
MVTPIALIGNFSKTAQCLKVDAEINLKYKLGSTSQNITKTGTSGKPDIAEENIKKHPQTKKLLTGYAKGVPPGNEMYRCAEGSV